VIGNTVLDPSIWITDGAAAVFVSVLALLPPPQPARRRTKHSVRTCPAVADGRRRT
jgi:hypothetical protein